jgi:hypothetical protein
MANELIRPIDVDTARAIEESAKAASTAVSAAVLGGHYIGAVAGDLPHDLVGLIGDWVKHKRIRRWTELSAETDRILRERGVENRQDVSPSVAIPLIDAAINEDRNELKQLWAKLLASSMDPGRTNLVRPSLIDLLKNLDPLDARILELMQAGNLGNQGDLTDRLKPKLQVDRTEIFYSLEHLFELKCLSQSPQQIPAPQLTAKAQLLMRAVA